MNQAWFQYKILPLKAAKDFLHNPKSFAAKPQIPLVNRYQKTLFLQKNGKTLTGFVEILGEGKTRVVLQHYIMIRELHNQAHITGGFTANRPIKERNIYILDREN